MKTQTLFGMTFALLFSTMTLSAQVNAQRENQQDRIAQGVDSGQLTAAETKNLETREASLNRTIHNDRAANGGTLTAPEKANIRNRQVRLSKSIYADKHNGNVATYGNGVVGQRRENQQDRIAQGIKSGSLSAGQTARLESQQQSINHQIGTDRATNGGKLTVGQRAQINRRQNQASRNIYEKKHS